MSDVDGSRIAGAETVLQPGHRYIVAAKPEAEEEGLQLLRGRTQFFGRRLPSRSL